MFSFLKKNTAQVVAPATGQLIPIDQVEDEVFSNKMMGDGFAVRPTECGVFAPLAGKITTVFPTKHAIGITTEHGLEVLVHMALDTVELKGDPFTVYVKLNDEVKPGDQLADMDLQKVAAGGKTNTIVVVYTNMDKLEDIPIVPTAEVSHGDEVEKLKYTK